MNELLAALEKLGRTGAVIALGVGAGCISAGVWLVMALGPANGEAVWSPRATLFSGGAMLTGAMFLLYAFTLFRRAPKPKLPKPSADEFQRAAAQFRRPFFACVECRLLYSNTECAGTCANCGSTADCMEVRGEDELKLLFATLEDAR